MGIKIRKLSHALGAEVSGVDITKPLTEEAFREIHQAFLQHCLLLFRGQPLTRAQYVAFSSRFGKLRKKQPGNLPDYQHLEGVHIEQETELDHSSVEKLEAMRRAKTSAHRLVRAHPETGRKSLYVGDKTRLIAGMTAEESEGLLGFLRNHVRRPQFLYRHQWQKDDLIVWDQRCTNHNAIGDFDRRDQLRFLEKTTLRGPATGRPYDDPTRTRNMTTTFTI